MADIPMTIHNTMGAEFVSIVTSSILFGVAAVQTWSYFNTTTKDPHWLKALVALVMLSVLAHMMLIASVVYHYLISHFADPAELNVVFGPIVAQVIPSGFAALLCQIFFAIRIWRLSNKSLIYTIPVAILIAVQCAVAIGFTATTLQIKDPRLTSKAWTGALDSTSAVTDVVISAMLIQLLASSKTEYQQTNNLINKLILFSLNTGLITTVCAIAAMTCYYALPTTVIYVAIYWLLPLFYANSLLATLNARDYLRGQMSTKMSYSLDDRRARTNLPPGHSGISVQLDVVKEHMTDEQSDHVTSKSHQMV